MGDAVRKGFRVRHDSGRLLHLDELWQFPTHRGLLAGQPTRELNAAEVEATVRLARQRYGPVALLPPAERVLEAPKDAEFGELIKHAPEFWPVGIPWTTCVGRFVSFEAVRDPGESYSHLTVVWYQDEFGPPVAVEALTKIRELDWNALAADASD